MYSNNAKWELLGNIWASTTTMTIKDSKWGLFPSTYPYYLTLEQVVNETVTAREIVQVTNRVADTFTIVRSAWYCPVDDNAITQTNTAKAFTDWALVQLRAIAEDFTQINNDLKTLDTDKLDKSGWTMTWVLNLALWTNIASATTTNLATLTGNSATVTWITTITSFWTVPAWTKITLTFEWILTITHNATSLILPWLANITTAAWDVIDLLSLWGWNWRCIWYQKSNWQSVSAAIDITWLTEKTSASSDDYFILTDSENSNANKKIKFSNMFWRQIFWDWSDWILNISSWTLTLPFIDWLVIKNYSSINISWSALLNFSWKTINWGIAILNCLWDFTMSWGTIDISSMWADWWVWISSANASWNIWNNWLTLSWINVNWWSRWNYASDTLPVIWFRTPLNYEIWIACWSWWWSWWTQNTWTWASWSWWVWWWCLIINVWWNVNLSWGIINANWWNWWNSTFTWNWWWWGWWWWWRIWIFYAKDLISNITNKTANWWTWWSYSWIRANAWWGWGWIWCNWQTSWTRTVWTWQPWSNGLILVTKINKI